MVGFLLMWPALPTLAMFPVLVWVYRRLALREETEVAARFGPAWDAYAAITPRFLPSRHRRQKADADTCGSLARPVTRAGAADHHD
jgi:hypothetical protein